MPIRKNPLLDFKEISGMSFRELEAKTGISMPQLVRLINKDAFDLQATQVSTLLILNATLHIDMIAYIINNVFPELKKK